jgi:formate-dependent nitrite reductase membrane component NrfD
MKKLISGVSAGIAAVALPVLALAQTLPPSPFVDINGFKTFFCTTVVGWIFTFLVVLAVIFVLIAAYRYLTSNGDEEKVHSAGQTLIYAAVAIGVALLARGIPLIVGTFVGGNANVGC